MPEKLRMIQPAMEWRAGPTGISVRGNQHEVVAEGLAEGSRSRDRDAEERAARAERHHRLGACPGNPGG
ncbi:MAG TPA: hypothetical protein VFW27_06560, partial [Actinoplanes sp.]|nr:hypothetical protein [Actinoplanes sp.]